MENIYKLDVVEEQIAGNPVGEVHWTDSIEDKINELVEIWRTQTDIIPWWKVWKRQSMNRVTAFLLESLDELIKVVDDAVERGADKKATVLAAIDKLYDFVAREAVPIFLRPFASYIKKYIIYTLVATSIDWIVSKYRDGSWKDKLEDIKDDLEENGKEETA